MQANTVPERDLAALRALKDWIETHTGIYYRHESQYILYCRLIQLCLKLNFKGLEALLQELRSGQNPQLSLSIAQYVSTTHTHFSASLRALIILNSTFCQKFAKTARSVFGAQPHQVVKRPILWQFVWLKNTGCKRS